MQVTEQEISGWAHCEDALCPANAQAKVKVVAVTTSWTGGDREGGGTVLGRRGDVLSKLIENSSVEYRFAHPEERACPCCGRDRVADAQKRPTYENRSGHSQKGLLWIKQYGSVAAGEAHERAEIANKAAEAKEAELAARRRLEAAEKELADGGNGHEPDRRPARKSK